MSDEVTNETNDAADTRATIPYQQPDAGGATAAAAMQRDGQAGASSEAKPANYVHNGGLFTDWFNDRLAKLVNPTISLGTKQASAIRLHADGRLECALSGVEDGGATQFVAFEPKYLDQLVRKIGAIGL